MVKRRKRRPGGGRKPMKPGTAKSESLTIRLRPDMRRLIVEEARASGHPISTTAELLMKAGLTDLPDAPADRSLLSAITLLIGNIQRDTGKSWRDDTYTAQAVGHGIDALLREYGASSDGNPPMPEAIELRMANMPEDFAERFRAPAHFGQMHAFNLIKELKKAASPEPVSRATEPLLFFGAPGRLSNIGRELEKAVRDINQKGKRK